VYDELLSVVIEDLGRLNLNYKIEKGGGAEGEQEGQFQSGLVHYVPYSSHDQQFLVRVGNFVEMFLLECRPQWFLRWIPQFCSQVVQKASQTPRVSKLYGLLKTAMQVA